MKVLAKEWEGVTPEERWRSGNSTIIKCTIKEVLQRNERDAILSAMQEIMTLGGGGDQESGKPPRDEKTKRVGHLRVVGKRDQGIEVREGFSSLTHETGEG